MGAEPLDERLPDLGMPLIDLGRGEGARGIAIVDRDGEARVARGHLLARVAVDQLDVAGERAADFPDGAGDGFKRSAVAHHEGKIALYGRDGNGWVDL